LAQEQMIASEMMIPDQTPENDALTVCKKCGKLVPRTMMCLYCGNPILYRKHRSERQSV